MSDKMRLSHILYKVKNLHEAVKDFEEMGFTVRYGTKKEKAFNALIWFEEGPFIELFTIKKSSKILTLMLKLIGKKSVAKRFNYFVDAKYGWCEYSIENTREDLEKENIKLKEMNCEYGVLNGRRNNINGLKLKWKLSIPMDLGLPFLMSAYTPDPRPKSIIHKNGAKSVSKLMWGVSDKNMNIINELVDDERMDLIEGNGFKKIEFDGYVNEHLNKGYYK